MGTDDKSRDAPSDAAARTGIGPAALKAYAHPLRVQIIRHLNDHGPATATTLAAALGESTGQTSYHLRQLARHGLAEEDTARGTGRERWWRSRSIEVGPEMLDDPATEPAMRFLLDRMVEDRAATLRRLVTRADLPEEWRAIMSAESTLRIDGAEMAELNAALQATLDPYVQRSRARRDDPAWRERPSVRVYIDSFPLLDD
ncbi:helix-turn-helix domain-containing protein [Actinotalea sp. Marseille-Q4924]|uniref:winged helix-turn-helix domain-containing protein n=1 Tax=Actinotalea sp. Marseille-Q4924 TaxID=2866571 RepID=UPI001CE4787C|nr:helix-turn-helix domain-containing protein [Actinotalea sp. Marseille-Q4924]